MGKMSNHLLMFCLKHMNPKRKRIPTKVVKPISVPAFPDMLLGVHIEDYIRNAYFFNSHVMPLWTVLSTEKTPQKGILTSF